MEGEKRLPGLLPLVQILVSWFFPCDFTFLDEVADSLFSCLIVTWVDVCFLVVAFVVAVPEEEKS